MPLEEPIVILDENPITVEISAHVLNNKFVPAKQQDRCFIFKGLTDYNGDKIDAFYTFDGHGRNETIHAIDKMPLEEIAKLQYPLAEILRLLDVRARELVKSNKNGLNSTGSTYILTRVYANRMVINYCGDSEVMVFKNGVKVLETIPHNVYNPTEMTRIQAICHLNTPEKGGDLSLLSKDTITMVESNRLKLHNPNTFEHENTLAPTMALGHNRLTGYDFVDGVEGAIPDYIVEFDETDEIVLVQGTDGLWDMVIKDDPDDINDLLTLDAVELVKKYRDRWFQTWNYIVDVEKPAVVAKTLLNVTDPDDISAVVYRRTRNT